MAESIIKSQGVKSESFTKTSDSGGYVSLVTSTTKVVVGVHLSTPNTFVTGIFNDSNNTWYVPIASIKTISGEKVLALLPHTAVSGTYYYLDS